MKGIPVPIQGERNKQELDQKFEKTQRTAVSFSTDKCFQKHKEKVLEKQQSLVYSLEAACHVRFPPGSAAA